MERKDKGDEWMRKARKTLVFLLQRISERMIDNLIGNAGKNRENDEEIKKVPA